MTKEQGNRRNKSVACKKLSEEKFQKHKEFQMLSLAKIR